MVLKSNIWEKSLSQTRLPTSLMENALIFSTSIVYVSKWDLLQFFSISITYEPNHEKLPLYHRLGEVFFSTGNLMLSQTLWCRGLFNILTAFILIGQGMSKSFWDADKHTFCDTFGHPKGCPIINNSLRGIQKTQINPYVCSFMEMSTCLWRKFTA